MNKRRAALGSCFRWLKIFTLLTVAWMPVLSSAAISTPRIHDARMEKGTVSVVVDIPAGVVRVTLESRSRLGAGTWVPRAVVRPKASETQVTFRLPASSQLEVLRIRTDSSEPLPASFYAGTNTFNGQASSGGPAAGAVGALDPNNKGDAMGGTGAGPTGTAAPAREVVESDIWELDGTTLYFFNQYRGLQVIDVSDASAPKITGMLPLPAAGEQMYQLDKTHLVLLARDGCGWGVDGPQSKVLIVEVKNGVPAVQATVPVAGNITESRLVGTALYLASEAYRSVPATDPNTGKGGTATDTGTGASGGTGSSGGTVSSTWEWGTVVSSLDLADAAHPVARNSSWYSGYGNAVMATDRYLFVSTLGGAGLNWWQSRIQVIDISAADGTMLPKGLIQPAGQVMDKFKMNLSGDTFTVISQASIDSRGLVTTLQTYSLTTPDAPAKLGRLELGAGEQLHATRFDGDRVYVVTFFRKDPLWVVDLSDPTQPHIAGELQVPGWSTYIDPIGDGRLVTVGIDDTNSWRVAVSLFNVKDPAHPTLLSKVPLGQNYSWSEALTDEKAFNVMPEAGLVLVPYQGYSTNGYASRVQLIDLGADTLTLRGLIEHAFQPRRTAYQNGTILSVSGQELLVVDAANRDLPKVKADLALSWPVNQVFVQGKYLVEIANGSTWDSRIIPMVRVTLAASPDASLAELELTNGLPVVGAVVRNQKLYLALAQNGGMPIYYDAAGGGSGAGSGGTNAPNLVVVSVDLGNLPQLKLIGQTEVTTEPLGWNNSYKAVFPRDDLLVWVGGGGGMWLMGGGIVSGGVATGGAMPIRPWYGGTGGRLWAFQLQDNAAPAFLSQMDVSTNGWWSFSDPFSTPGLVYLSHQSSKFLEGVLMPGEKPPAPTVTYDKASGRWVTNQPAFGVWVQQYNLDVVDYADAKNPTLRPPVNIPGTLQGLSHGGAILFTRGPHWDTNWVTDWTEFVDAAAYDGVSASLVDSLMLPRDWPHAAVVGNDLVFVARPATTNSPNSIEAWTFSSSGKFEKAGSVELGSAAQNLARFGKTGGLLAAQTSDPILLLDVTAPAAMKIVAKHHPDGCLWFDLTRSDGDVGSGLWIPLGDYGVDMIPILPP